MFALDTNVLVRFLVEDDELQSLRASKLIAAAISRDEPLFVSGLVVCELVWVLETAYKVRKQEVVSTLKQLLHAKHLCFDDEDCLNRGLHAYEQGRGDFSDYLIREHAMVKGCVEVKTFDKALLREAGFTAP